MPTVHLVPTKRGMAPDEVVGRLQGGWKLLGRQAVQKGSGVATPSNPEGMTLEDADVWMLDEPMIPMGMVASMVLQVATEYDGADAVSCLDPLNCLAREIFGIGLAELQQAIEEAAGAQGPDPSGD